MKLPHISRVSWHSGVLVETGDSHRHVATAATPQIGEMIRRRCNMHDDLVGALQDMQRVIDALMPGIKHIAVQDYAIINEAPFRAARLIEAASKPLEL